MSVDEAGGDPGDEAWGDPGGDPGDEAGGTFEIGDQGSEAGL